MKCEDFKKYMADLCDKQTDPAIAEACRQHMKECASCRAYYEDFMQTVDLLTPKHSPEFGKQKPVITLQPSQPQGAPQQKLIRRILQVAAAIAIFLAGVGTGLSNLFSTQAEAVTAIPLVFEQSIQKSRDAESFSMSIYARTTPKENFAYINPESGFTHISIKSMRQEAKTFWRIEKEGGRTIMSDGEKQYMWDTNGSGVYGTPDANFAEGFATLLHPETLLERQKRALLDDKGARMETTETDSTITIVTHTQIYGSDIATLMEGEETSYRCTTENVFSKEDKMLKSIQIWWERNGQKTLVLKSERIDYNLHLTPTQLIQRPDTTQVTWLPAHAPEIQVPVRLKKLKNETAPEAAQRVLKALTCGKPQMAGEALYYYTASLPTLSEDLKGCKASDFSEAKEKKGYNGVIVFYKLTHPDGSSAIRHIALRRDNPQGIWMVDGGL